MDIKATCSCCGRTETRNLTEVEEYNLLGYRKYGRQFGMLQNLFPDIPAWIRSGAIDMTSGGFCICQECGGN